MDNDDKGLLRQTRDAVMEIRGALKIGEKRFDDIEEQLHDHHQILHHEFAKGRPGLIEAVGDQVKYSNIWSRLAWLLIGAMISMGGGAVILLLRK